MRRCYWQLTKEQRIRRNCVKPSTCWCDRSPVLTLGTANLNFPNTLTKYLPLNFHVWDSPYNGREWKVSAGWTDRNGDWQMKDVTDGYKLNVVVEWLTRLLRIREVPGSNLGPDTGYTDRFFVVFVSPSRQVLGWYLKLGHDRFLPHNFKLIYLLPLHSELYSLSLKKCR
jgi:hypothetical protein